MNIEIFSLCDAATGDFGKLSMLGAFDSLWVHEFPAAHPHCAIALRLRFSAVEAGQHKCRVTIMDESGKHIVKPLEGQVSVNAPKDRSTIAINLILNLQGVTLPHEGEYSIDLAMDGRQEATLPLFVRHQEKPSPNTPN